MMMKMLVVLVVDVLSLPVDLVFQGEVEVELLHPLSVEHLDLGLVLLALQVLDHVREPHRQPVVAATQQQQQQHCRRVGATVS